jgi:FKBP-type peptidyl-prolyl cis-trans isomerase FkpA
LLSLVSLLFVSCISDTEKSSNVDYTAQNEKEIVDYITANKLVAQKKKLGFILCNQ